MTESSDTQPIEQPAPKPEPITHVAPSPHVDQKTMTTRRMMTDVLIALVPLMVMSVVVFRQAAVIQLAICVVTCLVAEMMMTFFRRKPVSVFDASAVVTGVILALSLPATSPWFVTVIAGASAVILAKMIFGGLGQNIFNPAMVGRAFVMICFAQFVGANAYVDVGSGVEALTQATPMTAFKEGSVVTTLMKLFIGNTNGSLGETCAPACMLGGLFLCIRRTAAWQIPAGVLISTAVIGGLVQVGGSEFSVAHHLFGGALMFGAFFIATDPVTSPITPKGRWIFGLGLGAMVMMYRTMSGYPEGVMFAVLVMNAVTPLINRWTIPTPVGGTVPVRK